MQSTKIDFTYRESKSIKNMLEDITGENKLNGRNPIEFSMENGAKNVKNYKGEGGRLFLKLAFMDNYKYDVSFVGLSKEDITKVLGEGTVGDVLFNLYASDALKNDEEFAYDLIKINGANLIDYDLPKNIRENERLVTQAIFSDRTLNRKVFLAQNSDFQKDISNAYVFLSNLYNNYKAIGLDPYQVLTTNLFEDLENSAIRITDREVVNSWLSDNDLMHRLENIDKRFGSLPKKEALSKEKALTKKIISMEKIG